MTTTREFKIGPWLGLGALATLALGVLWIVQIVNGLVVTDMRNLTSWGLYIAMFIFMEGLASGALVLACFPSVFKTDRLGNIPRVSLAVGFVAMILALVFIVVDLGRPERSWMMITSAHPGSPLFWDVVVVTLFLIVSAALLWITYREKNGHNVSETVKSRLGWTGFLLGIVTPAVTAMVFSTQVGRGVWNTGLLVPMFVTAALATGIAAAIVCAWWMNSAGAAKIRGDWSNLALVLGVIVLLDLGLLAAEIAVPLFEGAGSTYEATLLMLTGSMAPLFWTQIICGIIGAILLLAPKFQSKLTFIGVGSILVLIELGLKRYNLVVQGFGHKNITDYTISTGPGVPSEDSFWNNLVDGGFYFPTPLEIGLTVAAIGFGFLIFLLITRLTFPKVEQVEAEKKEPVHA